MRLYVYNCDIIIDKKCRIEILKGVVGKFEKIIPIALIMVFCLLIIVCNKKCDICQDVAANYKEKGFDLCYDCYMKMLENSQDEAADSSDNSKSDGYSLKRGVNGRYTYKCRKICSEECGNACETCLMNGESFKRSPWCCFDYGASEEIGWIGCPDCGDVSYSEWYNWYEKAQSSHSR